MGSNKNIRKGEEGRKRAMVKMTEAEKETKNKGGKDRDGKGEKRNKRDEKLSPA